MTIFAGANGGHSMGYNVIKNVLAQFCVYQFEFFKKPMPPGTAVLTFVYGAQEKVVHLEISETESVESVIKRIKDEINGHAPPQGQ